ncbi:MAG: ATP-binding protein [Prevotellaceae bacterium]|nr:ATP-binding protein [Prevotellaceae bacterium]
MISKKEIEQTSDRQINDLLQRKSYPREAIDCVHNIDGFATVISGVRRCGKSTFMSQLIKREIEINPETKVFYLNFDTPAMYGFSMDHFALIDDILNDRKVTSIYMDEVQIVDGWEVYVRGKLDDGYRVTVTGSNASMLSRELGTKLTGRHLTYEMFPFSYNEFCGFIGMEATTAATRQYMNKGGFPAYLSSGEPAVLNELVNDLIYRDIAVRYKLRDAQTLKRVAAILLSNIGNIVTATKMKAQLGLGSVTTMNEYLSYFNECYLFDFVSKFSYSTKARTISPRKVYCIDTGVVNVAGSSFSRNDGHNLENMVYMALRRHTKDIYYYNNQSGECDFIVADNLTPSLAIQVCHELSTENRVRETKGLLLAMEELDISKGMIITTAQEDTIIEAGKRIEIVSFDKLDKHLADI